MRKAVDVSMIRRPGEHGQRDDRIDPAGGQVERDVGVPVARLDVSAYQLELPGFIVHAEDDPLVAASEARIIHQAWFDSQLLVLPEGGHQRVLADPRLSEAVLELLARASAPARQTA